MSEHSPAAIAAYPYIDPPRITAHEDWVTDMQRTAYDLGAATTWATTREALATELDRIYSEAGWGFPATSQRDHIVDSILASGAIVDVEAIVTKVCRDDLSDYYGNVRERIIAEIRKGAQS